MPDEAYVSRDATGLVIESHGYVSSPFSCRIRENMFPYGCIPIRGKVSCPSPARGTRPWTRSWPTSSDSDREVPYTELSYWPGRKGALVLVATSRLPIEETTSLGCGRSETSSCSNNPGTTLHPPLPDIFDRNIRAFGNEVQRVLGDLRVAVVGCGGTGSAVIEQLVRLGVRHFHLLDPDVLTESNLTRVYGSFPENIGVPKVNVMEAHVCRIAPDAKVLATQSKITSEATARLLTDVDVVFGCTDDNAGRLVLSRLASYMLTPVIDCGVVLSSDEDGHITGIDGRVTVLAPGAGCLVCRNRIDLQRAAAEMMSPGERQRRADEGYAPALEGVEPAVVTFTTQTAAAAVSELLERLIRYGPEPVPSEILLRAHEREVSTNVQAPRERHYCHPDSGKLGLGDHRAVVGASMAGLKGLVAWWQRLSLPWRSWRMVGQVCSGDEVPDQLPNRGVVLVGPTERRELVGVRLPLSVAPQIDGEPGQFKGSVLEDRQPEVPINTSQCLQHNPRSQLPFLYPWWPGQVG